MIGRRKVSTLVWLVCKWLYRFIYIEIIEINCWTEELFCEPAAENLAGLGHLVHDNMALNQVVCCAFRLNLELRTFIAIVQLFAQWRCKSKENNIQEKKKINNIRTLCSVYTKFGLQEALWGCEQGHRNKI